LYWERCLMKFSKTTASVEPRSWPHWRSILTRFFVSTLVDLCLVLWRLDSQLIAGAAPCHDHPIAKIPRRQ
jgi:hypothetical protein